MRISLPRLKSLGLYMVSMGVETPSTTALSNYNKKQNPELAEKAMKIVKDTDFCFLQI